MKLPILLKGGLDRFNRRDQRSGIRDQTKAPMDVSNRPANHNDATALSCAATEDAAVF